MLESKVISFHSGFTHNIHGTTFITSFFFSIYGFAVSHRTEWVVRYQSSRLAQNSIWFCLQDSYIVTPVIGIMSRESNREI